MAKIDLAHLLDIDLDKLHQYKLHLAIKNDENTEPLDVFIKDRKKAGEVDSNWWGWNAWYPGWNRWGKRQYILSFMRVHPKGKDVWLFGGIFEIKGWLQVPKKKEKGRFYDVHLMGKGREYIGCLTITYHNTAQNMYRNLEKYYSDLNDGKIETLEEPYRVTYLRTKKT